MKKKTKPIVFLEGKRLYLRPIESSDIPALCRYINDPEVRCYLSNNYPISLLAEQKYTEKKMEMSDSEVILAICLKKGDRFIGVMGLHKIDYINRTATTGAMIGEKSEWNKGYGQEAKNLLLTYAFNTLNLRKISSAAIAANKRSIQHNIKCGYKLEGVMKKEFFKSGRYYDKVILSVFKSDWAKFKKQNGL